MFYSIKMRNKDLLSNILLKKYSYKIIFLVLFVNKARSSANLFHQTNRNASEKKKFKDRFPLWKLALNVGTFTLFNLPYASFAIFMINNHDKCFFLHNFEIMFRLLGLIRFSLLLRILIDPLLSFLTDLQVYLL